MTDTYACLGFVAEIEFSSDDSDYLVRFPQKKSWSIKGKRSTVLLALSKRELIMIPWRARSVKVSRYHKGAGKIYQLWSGYDIDRAFSLTIPKKKTDLDLLGRITRIEYTSDKLERRGDHQGKFHLYRHDFLKPPLIFANNNKNPSYWAIRSNKTLVTSLGLVG